MVIVRTVQCRARRYLSSNAPSSARLRDTDALQPHARSAPFAEEFASEEFKGTKRARDETLNLSTDLKPSQACRTANASGASLPATKASGALAQSLPIEGPPQPASAHSNVPPTAPSSHEGTGSARGATGTSCGSFDIRSLFRSPAATTSPAGPAAAALSPIGPIVHVAEPCPRCPICNAPVEGGNAELNRHVDACLGMASTGSSQH